MSYAHADSHSHIGLYAKIFAALVVLTIITVGAAYIEFGTWNLVVAMLIASVKAGLVALFFMHLKYENPTTWLYAGFPIFLLALLLAGVFIDNPFRNQGYTEPLPTEQLAPTGSTVGTQH